LDCKMSGHVIYKSKKNGCTSVKSSILTNAMKL
jgi:hypothetical protein